MSSATTRSRTSRINREFGGSTEVFSRSAEKYPNFTALQIPHSGESLTFAELDGHAENVAAAVQPLLTGPDQVVAVAMSQDSWHIVAAHLGVLRAGGTLVVLDTTLPDALIAHMINDARPVVVLRADGAAFRDLPTLDVLTLPERAPKRNPPSWLDDPTQRLATIFYTSGTTGIPKGVECPHAGYVNLALTYADYFALIPGVDATSLTASLGYDGCISEMYSAWVSGCAVVMLTKEEETQPRAHSCSRVARSRGHGAFLSAGASLHAHINTGSGSSISLVPLHRACRRSLSQRAGRALDAVHAPGDQHLRPDGGEHRHEPPEFAARRADHARLSVRQRHLRDT